tara:strand:- start:58 stop:618 length:561 start_codon:yes stop_codon:yes gene_type:complete
MAKHLSNYISVYDDVLKKEHCEHLIKEFEHLKSHQKRVEKENHRYFTEINMNQDSRWKDYIQVMMKGVYTPNIEKYIKDNNIQDLQWPKKYAYEEIRFKKYELNGVDEFKEHVDVYDRSSAKRFLVFFLYLNDNDGGHTTFPEFNIKVKPKAGRMLMFPPTWTYRHTAEKPIKEPKYILGSYLHYV